MLFQSAEAVRKTDHRGAAFVPQRPRPGAIQEVTWGRPLCRVRAWRQGSEHPDGGLEAWRAHGANQLPGEALRV